MMHRFIFFSIILIDAIVLFFQTSELSISYREAELLYGEFSFLQLIINTSIYLFGQNDFALRLPMIIFHLLSIVLLSEISKKYIPSAKNRLWLILAFILLPGVVSSSLIVNSAGMLIFGILLFAYIYEKYSIKIIYLLLPVYAVLDAGFVYLFLGLITYHLFSKEKQCLIYNLAMFGLSTYIYGFEAHGIPSGHFLDAIGVYAAVFSPIIFVYLFYSLYRRYLTDKMDLEWYIASTALLVSLMLSFRQRVSIEHFAPYLMLGLPLAAQTFISSYRVRLKMFRGGYKTIFVVSFILLILNTVVVFFNKELYLIIENPKKHFAYDMHVAKELSKELKSKGINCVKTDRKNALRLKFYGISTCEEHLLVKNRFLKKKDSDVTISYKNVVLYSANVTKINKE
ncbi:MAG: hypothetical protein ABFQ64_09925 [Campylobacterota bacterium]